MASARRKWRSASSEPRSPEQVGQAVQPVQQPNAGPRRTAASARRGRGDRAARRRRVLFDVVDVIAEVDHRVAGRLMVGAERSLGGRERVTAGADRFVQAALPPQVRRRSPAASSLGVRPRPPCRAECAIACLYKPLLLAAEREPAAARTAPRRRPDGRAATRRAASRALRDERAAPRRIRCAPGAPRRGGSGCSPDRAATAPSADRRIATACSSRRCASSSRPRCNDIWPMTSSSRACTTGWLASSSARTAPRCSRSSAESSRRRHVARIAALEQVQQELGDTARFGERLLGPVALAAGAPALDHRHAQAADERDEHDRRPPPLRRDDGAGTSRRDSAGRRDARAPAARTDSARRPAAACPPRRSGAGLLAHRHEHDAVEVAVRAGAPGDRPTCRATGPPLRRLRALVRSTSRRAHARSLRILLAYRGRDLGGEPVVSRYGGGRTAARRAARRANRCRWPS